MIGRQSTEANCYETGNGTDKLHKSFGVLCWNVHKSKRTKPYRKIIEHWRKIWKLELILLQEARIRTTAKAFLLPDFSYCAAPNIRLPRVEYGLLTAASVPSVETIVYRSSCHEAIVGPGKGVLLTKYRLEKEKDLIVVNLHAINFRSSKIYRQELTKLSEHLREYSGAMIVAGDFNSWSETRHRILEDFRKGLELNQVPYDKARVKSFRGYPLDFILYRELKLICQESYILPDYSDHNPLLAEFSI
jgi:endonuclease/exonuclease/phosphatase (EEP) superfamily protein YafD